jgi:D-glycerate 3-kinase
MSDAEIARFIQYYQRITEQCLLDLPGKVNHLFMLSSQTPFLVFSVVVLLL